MDLLAGLNSFFDKDPKASIDDYFPELNAMFMRKGQLYAIPWLWSTYSMIYNKDEFGKAGLANPTDSWNWDHLLAAARKMTYDSDGNGHMDYWGFGDSWPHASSWPIWVLGAGGKLWNADRTKVLIDSPEAIYGTKFEYDLFWTHHVGPRTIGNSITAEEPDLRIVAGGVSLAHTVLFDKGRLGILYATRFYLPGSVNSDVAPIPYGPAGIRASTVSAQWFSMSASTRHPNEAWQLMKYLTGTEAWEYTQTDPKVLDTRKRGLMPQITYTVNQLRRSLGGNEQAWVTSLAGAEPSIGTHPVGPNLNSMVLNTLGDVARKKSNLAAAMTELARQMNVLINETRQKLDWTK